MSGPAPTLRESNTVDTGSRDATARRRKRVWPLTLAAREGAATARHGRWTSVMVVIATAWLIAAPAIADAVGVTRLMEAEQAWIDAGGHVYIATGASIDGQQNPIPTRVCESLASYDGVEGSFAVTRSEASGTLAHLPGGRASIYSASAGVLPFFHVEGATSGVIMLTEGFSTRTGVTDGEPVTVIRGATPNTAGSASAILTARVADTASIGDEYDGALISPDTLGPEADSCYVRTDAARHSAVAAILPSLLAHDGRTASVSERLYSNEFTVDYTTAYEDRPLRWLWAASALALGLMWAMVQWFRRSHMAIYSTFGMHMAPRLTMQVSEWLVLAGLGLAAGWSLGIVGALALGARTEPTLSVVSTHAALTLIGASLLVIVLGLRPTGTLLTALKDR